MKKYIALIFLLCCAPLPCPAANASEELDIDIILIRGERSKDSHSTKKTISLKGRELKYDVTYHGRSGGKREPVHKVFQIKDSEIKRVRAVIKQKDLLTSTKKEFTFTGGYTYFDISLHIRMNEKVSSINLSGSPRNTEIKADPLYQNSEALVKEIFGIINSRDKSIDYVGIIF